MRATSTCPGCGLELVRHPGRTHPYIGASPACWALYGDVLARGYGDARYRPAHTLAVDTYAVQHPGVPEQRAIRSVAVHLMRLCLVFERGLRPQDGRRLPARFLLRQPELRWLDPPRPNGGITVAEVHAAAGPEDHARRVAEWAADVWHAWAPHHETVRAWVDHSLGPAG